MIESNNRIRLEGPDGKKNQRGSGPPGAREPRSCEMASRQSERGQPARSGGESGGFAALISMVVNGHQGPGKQLLGALARLPDVNAEWVLRGIGQPLLPATRGTLPISPCVLPGPPLAYPHMLTGSRHAVPTALEQDARYWLQIQPQSPLIQVDKWKFRSGDLLLMETSSDWTSRLELALDSFVALASTARLGRRTRWACWSETARASGSTPVRRSSG